MMMTWINEFWEDESGLGTIELVLLVLILAGLAVAFKDKIVGFLNSLTESYKAATYTDKLLPK